MRREGEPTSAAIRRSFVTLTRAVNRAETRLEFFKKVMFEVVLEMGGNNFFQYFGEKWEIGNGPVICKCIWIKGGFFENWSDYGSFKGRWNVARLEGVAIRWLRAEVFAFTRAVGNGSRAQVVGFIFLIIFSNSSCDFWKAL